MINSTDIAPPLAPRPDTGNRMAKNLLLSEPSTRANGKRRMRLADFILTNRDAILAEWEEFAKTCSPASGSMGIAALSGHAAEIGRASCRERVSLNV